MRGNGAKDTLEDEWENKATTVSPWLASGFPKDR
jgi:hypothetical protein